MIADRGNGIHNLVLTCQCAFVWAASWIWLALWRQAPIDLASTNQHLVYSLFMLLGLVVGSRTLRTDIGLRVPGLEETTRRSCRQIGATLFYLLLYLVAVQEPLISPLFVFSLIPLQFLVLFVTNRYLPRFIAEIVFRKSMEQKVLLYGPQEKALEVRKWLDRNNHLGLAVQGLLTEDGAIAGEGLPPVLGKPQDLKTMLTSPGITQVIMAEFPRGNESMKDYTQLCEERGSRLLVVADLDRMFGHPVSVFEDQGLFFLGLREEPLENPVNRFTKRCLDIAVSLPVVVLLLPPLMLLVRLAQVLQSPGPLFFWQAREGLHNEPFDVLKFRTMHVGSASDEKLPSSKDDPRLYPVGSFMRKTSLDEIPQFWNVLCGKMSVVGPRPHLKTYNDQYRRVFSRAYVRTFVKPGVTGLAQARGFRGDARTPEEVVHRMESDIEYLENWSFWLDCWLILRTAAQIVVPPKGAI